MNEDSQHANFSNFQMRPGVLHAFSVVVFIDQRNYIGPISHTSGNVNTYCDIK